MSDLKDDGTPNLLKDEEAALRKVIDRRYGSLGLMEIAIWRAAGRYYLEMAAKICDEMPMTVPLKGYSHGRLVEPSDCAISIRKRIEKEPK